MLKEKLKKIKPLVDLYRKLNAKKPRWPQEIRIVMDRETKKWIESLPTAEMNVLEISGNKWSYLPVKTFEELRFPSFDICKQKTDMQYDLIIAEQVFEHLLYPYRAGKNIYDMLRPGGYFLITTPFLLRIHDSPTDCTRWTPTGMQYFLNEIGFELDEVRVDSWGNKKSVIGNLDDWRVYSEYFHPLRNERDFPIVVWALARKVK